MSNLKLKVDDIVFAREGAREGCRRVAFWDFQNKSCILHSLPTDSKERPPPILVEHYNIIPNTKSAILESNPQYYGVSRLTILSINPCDRCTDRLRRVISGVCSASFNPVSK